MISPLKARSQSRKSGPRRIATSRARRTGNAWRTSPESDGNGLPRKENFELWALNTRRSRPAEAEELGGVGGGKGHGFVGAVVGDGRGIRDPARRAGQCGGLFQGETGGVN